MTFHFVRVKILVQRKFTTDRYVVYKWSGCKFGPSPKGEGLFLYFCREEGANEENRILHHKEQSGKQCDILHIVKLDDGRESVFLIQDMFPITEEYIEREYTIAGNHLMLTSEHTAKVVEQKARKVLGMLKRGVKFMSTQPDVMSILEKLK